MNIKELYEMPKIIHVKNDLLWNKIKTFIDENKLEIDDFEFTDKKDIYRFDSYKNSVYIHFTKKDGITAFMFFEQDAIEINGKTYPVIKQKETFNIKKKFKNFTLNIFKEMNRHCELHSD